MQDVSKKTPKTKDIALDSTDTISQIFDKILKRILLRLSKSAIIALINGLFGENFPTDSEVLFNATENLDGNLKKTMADIIITLRTKDRICRFHVEGQISDDNTIVLRVFEYGFHDAVRHQDPQGSEITLPFPKPIIIFLEHTSITPNTVTLVLDFEKQGQFRYNVPTIKFLDYSVEELCENQMVILLPLYLLKLRRAVENAKLRKHHKEEILRANAKKLKELIEKSLLPAIAINEKAGNITHSDAFELLKLLSKLYDYLYGDIAIFKEEEVKSMLADTLVLEYDVEIAEIEARHESEKMEMAHSLKREMARKFKNDGVPTEVIARNTGFTISEIDKL